jgi:hypothetical protein
MILTVKSTVNSIKWLIFVAEAYVFYEVRAKFVIRY